MEFLRNALGNCVESLFVHDKVVCSVFVCELIFHDFSDTVVIDRVGKDLRRLRSLTYLVVINRFGRGDLICNFGCDFFDACVVKHNFASLFGTIRHLLHHEVCEAFVVHFGSSRSRRHYNTSANKVCKAFVVNFGNFGRCGNSDFGSDRFCQSIDIQSGDRAFDTAVIYFFSGGKRFHYLFSRPVDDPIVVDLLHFAHFHAFFLHVHNFGYGNFFALNFIQNFDELVAHVFRDASVIDVLNCADSVQNLFAVFRNGFFRLFGNGIRKLLEIFFGKTEFFDLRIDIVERFFELIQNGLFLCDIVKLGRNVVRHDVVQRTGISQKLHVTMFKLVDLVEQRLNFRDCVEFFVYGIESFPDFLRQHGGQSVVNRLILLVAITDFLRNCFRGLFVFALQLPVQRADLRRRHFEFRQQRVFRLLQFVRQPLI